ncbi:MAG: N-acetyl-gamma-glutamyl-phosphate reductase [Desulfatibacillaceae bacterium]
MARQGDRIRAAVAGATGYAGAELVRLLWGHENVELAAVTSRQYAGTPLAAVYPALASVVPLVCREMDTAALCRDVDVVFTALPHKLPMSLVPEFLQAGVRVVDLSADFRFRNVAAYESAYQPHAAPEISRNAVYGLCEIYRDMIPEADVVGNPGCYPTSALLPLVPFVEKGLLDTGTIVIDSKSGVSGAGRALSLTTHFCEVTEGFMAYKVAGHRHCPEMEEVLSLRAGHEVRVSFVPHLVPMSRGMLTTSYSSLSGEMDTVAAQRLLADYYADSPFVRVHDHGVYPNTRHVRGTNYCDIGVQVDSHTGRLVLVSVIDNLGKGAAGQAVQNMNIMFGLDETAGLASVPYPV